MEENSKEIDILIKLYNCKFAQIKTITMSLAEEVKGKVDEMWAQFDTNNNGTLEKAELAITGGLPPDISFVLNFGLSDVDGRVSAKQSSRACTCGCGCVRPCFCSMPWGSSLPVYTVQASMVNARECMAWAEP